MSKLFLESSVEDLVLKRFYQGLRNRTQDTLRSFRSSNMGGGLPIVFDYVTDGRFNAAARKTRRAYHIEISSGVPVLVLALLDRLLCDDSVFPYLPPAEMRADPETIDFILE